MLKELKILICPAYCPYRCHLPIFRLTKAKSSSFSNFRRNSRRICKIPNKEVVQHQLTNYDALFFIFSSSSSPVWRHFNLYLIFEKSNLKLFSKINLDELDFYALSFYKSQNVLCRSKFFVSQPKNLTAFNGSSKTFVPAQKAILLNVSHLFVWHEMFVTGTICK